MRTTLTRRERVDTGAGIVPSTVIIVVVFPDEDKQQPTQRRCCPLVLEGGITPSVTEPGEGLDWTGRMSQVGASPPPRCQNHMLPSQSWKFHTDT